MALTLPYGFGSGSAADKLFFAQLQADLDAIAGAVGAAGQFPGTTTNDNAAAGNVGEEIQSTVLAGAAVALTSPNAANVTSIALTAGDWDVCAQVVITPGAGTNFTIIAGSMSTTSAVNDFTNPLRFGAVPLTAAGAVLASGLNFQVGPSRFSLAAPTTVFLVVLSIFTVSTAAAWGKIFARRTR